MNRIKMLREEKNITQEDLATKLELSKGVISLYENEIRKPSLKILEKLSSIFNCSIDYILCKSDVRNNTCSNMKDMFYLCPLYGRISAGQPNWVEDCLDGYFPIDPNLMNISNPEECFFLKVEGESMNKVIKNGSYALIRKTDYVENGEIAVVLINGFDATLKKFTKEGDVILLEPMSDDPTIHTQIYNRKNSISIIGKYIGKMEINER